MGWSLPSGVAHVPTGVAAPPQWGQHNTPLGCQTTPLGKSKHPSGVSNHPSGEIKTPEWGLFRPEWGHRASPLGRGHRPLGMVGPAPVGQDGPTGLVQRRLVGGGGVAHREQGPDETAESARTDRRVAPGLTLLDASLPKELHQLPVGAESFSSEIFLRGFFAAGSPASALAASELMRGLRTPLGRQREQPRSARQNTRVGSLPARVGWFGTPLGSRAAPVGFEPPPLGWRSHPTGATPTPLANPAGVLTTPAGSSTPY